MRSTALKISYPGRAAHKVRRSFGLEKGKPSWEGRNRNDRRDVHQNAEANGTESENGTDSKSTFKGITFTDVDEDHAKTLENRANWYEARWCALDQPEWNQASLLKSVQATPDMRLVTLEVEISRERVALLNAYKRVGQKASIRVNNGIEYQLKPASAPFPEALNRNPLYIVRGDLSAYDIKIATEATSVKAPLDVLVTEKSCPELYKIEDDVPIEVGPFRGGGLYLRDTAMAIYRHSTVVFFVEGEGIATARALIEATEDIPNLSLKFRSDARLYYKAPNEECFVFKDCFDRWATEHGCKVVTTTGSFQDAFDDDDTLVYEPADTLAVILTGGDSDTEKAALAVCKEAEITAITLESTEAPETEYIRTGAGQV